MAFLFKRNNGYYYAIYKDGSQTVWRSLGEKDEAQARRQFEEMKPFLDVHKPTNLAELTEAIMNYVLLNNRKGTVELYRISLRHLVDCLGNKPVRFLVAMDGERFKEYLLSNRNISSEGRRK